MRDAGRVIAETLAAVRAAAVPGVELRQLDLAQTCIREAGASLSGSRLPAGQVVVHGRPSGQRFQDGDVLSVDCGAIVDGWHGDAAITVHIGTPSEDDVRLVRAAEETLAAGVAASVPGTTPTGRGNGDRRGGLPLRVQSSARSRRARHRPVDARATVRARDGWGVGTADGRRAAHVEHTVAVTDAGPVVRTSV